MNPPYPNRRGIALIIVLSFLALMTVLIIAFFSSVTVETTATLQSDSGARSKQLADLSVNLVMGQIKQATSRGSGEAWVSQPGMIRTYANASGASAPLAYYKLYSSSDMEITASQISSFAAAAEVPPDWGEQKAQYTDLNAPCQDASGILRYPIFDPSASGVIAGCAITSAPVAKQSDANPAPMPVRWMYILRDGTLTASTGGTNIAMWPATGSTAYKSPTRDNPIVGRIAFWTDDETCKININTASEGTYWDIPRAKTTLEQSLGLYQPARNEWQRYPGHPATTCLSTVFPALTASDIFLLTPRVNGGGSNAGTAIPNAAIAADTDRLYASVDELMFNPLHTGTNAVGLTGTQIEQGKFFLTAHSCAPELNLFNQPRIACWPIHSGLAANYVTPYDKLIAFCSTVGGQPYYFQRQNGKSPSADISIPRNLNLYSYLQSLTSKAVPGFGGNFRDKYPADRDQILTEIFDYIRSTNLYDGNITDASCRFTGPSPNGIGWVIPTQKGATAGFGRALTLSELAIGFICNADGSDPTLGSNTPANPMLSGTKLAAGQRMVQAVIVPDFFSVMKGLTFITPDMRLVVSGLTAPGAFQLNGKSLFTSDSATVDYTANASSMDHGSGYGGPGGWRYFAAFQNPLSLVSKPLRITLPDSPAAPTMNFSGGDITLKLYSKTTSQLYQTFNLHLPAAPLLPVPRIADQGTPLIGGTQTEKEQWWIFNSMGSSAPWNAGRVGNAHHAPGNPGTDAITGLANRGAGAFFREEYDIVRSIVLRHGDYRLVAAKATVNDRANELYLPQPNYGSLDSNSCQLSHFKTTADLRKNATDPAGDSGRLYFSDVTPAPGCCPYIYPNAPDADRPEATGDFDTGLADSPDGAYINKPDEGDRAGLDLSPPQPSYFYQNQTCTAPGQTCFSPSRMIPSPGMFGSLPTGIGSGTPWKTLLFRPQGPDFPTSGTVGLRQHPAYTKTIPDHLIMDLFWMPVVEPYAVSEPFSTAGKVNLNYQLMPFTYIERSTALRAVFKAEKLGVIPNAASGSYKSGDASLDIRQEIDINNASSAAKKDSQIETLSQFAKKFDEKDLFKSATEICDLHIVPTGKALAEMPAFWNQNRLTGDNLRERVYTTLYPRLTTKSNTYAVHYRVQVLKQSSAGRSTPEQWATWDESKDPVLAESRGCTIIERYIDPNDPDLPDFATNTGGNPTRFPKTANRFNADSYYRFRIVSNRKFAP